MIVKDLEKLKIKSEPVETVEEAVAIIKQLEFELEQSGGIGLAAIQIGIPKIHFL